LKFQYQASSGDSSQLKNEKREVQTPLLGTEEVPGVVDSILIQLEISTPSFIS
jgi:hypothetical protein